MAKRSEIEAQMAALQKQLESADDEDDDYEVWVKNDKGNETRLPSKKAGGWLKENFGIDLHPAPAADDEGDDEDDEDDGVKKDKMPEGGYFSKRKANGR